MIVKVQSEVTNEGLTVPRIQELGTQLKVWLQMLEDVHNSLSKITPAEISGGFDTVSLSLDDVVKTGVALGIDKSVIQAELAQCLDDMRVYYGRNSSNLGVYGRRDLCLRITDGMKREATLLESIKAERQKAYNAHVASKTDMAIPLELEDAFEILGGKFVAGDKEEVGGWIVPPGLEGEWISGDGLRCKMVWKMKKEECNDYEHREREESGNLRPGKHQGSVRGHAA